MDSISFGADNASAAPALRAKFDEIRTEVRAANVLGTPRANTAPVDPATARMRAENAVLEAAFTLNPQDHRAAIDEAFRLISGVRADFLADYQAYVAAITGAK